MILVTVISFASAWQSWNPICVSAQVGPDDRYSAQIDSGSGQMEDSIIVLGNAFQVVNISYNSIWCMTARLSVDGTDTLMETNCPIQPGCCTGVRFRFAVRGLCPGVHDLRLDFGVDSYYDPLTPVFQWTVRVYKPLPNMEVLYTNPLTVRLRASDVPHVSWIQEIRVSWGDGASDSFSGSGNLASVSLDHVYAQVGRYPVRLSVVYDSGKCQFTSTRDVVVEPGIATPVESTTWGRVKSLYVQ